MEEGEECQISLTPCCPVHWDNLVSIKIQNQSILGVLRTQCTVCIEINITVYSFVENTMYSLYRNHLTCNQYHHFLSPVSKQPKTRNMIENIRDHHNYTVFSETPFKSVAGAVVLWGAAGSLPRYC